MNFTEVNDKDQKVKKKRKRFKEHHILVKVAFIISTIALAYAIVICIFVTVTQRPGELGLVIIEATVLAIALIGLLLSSISFGKGFNAYNISGFVSAIVVIAYYIAALAVAIGLWLQR
ncbi:MAG: hypothetical protein ACTSSB_14985 [Candidatus Heimdallarchaeota archaeon]